MVTWKYLYEAIRLKGAAFHDEDAPEISAAHGLVFSDASDLMMLLGNEQEAKELEHLAAHCRTTLNALRRAVSDEETYEDDAAVDEESERIQCAVLTRAEVESIVRLLDRLASMEQRLIDGGFCLRAEHLERCLNEFPTLGEHRDALDEARQSGALSLWGTWKCIYQTLAICRKALESGQDVEICSL